MLQKTLIALSLICSASAMAKVINYKPVSMGVEKGDRLEIRGFNGKLSIVGKEGASALSFRVTQTNPDDHPSFAKSLFDEWNFSFKKVDGVIRIEVQSPPSKKSWNQLLMAGLYPSFDLVIQAPSLPVDVHWKKGSVNLKNWASGAQIHLHDGQAFVQKMNGSLQLTSHKGKLTVADHTGNVDVETYSAKTVLRKITGNAKVENFSGATELSEVEGDLEVNAFKGLSKILKSKGRLDFRNGRSTFQISKFEGPIRGQSGQGKINASVVGEADIRVKTNEGPVTLRAAGSGAWANFGSKEGTLYVPNFLKLTRTPNIKIRQGSLRGRQKGRIFVRTESGDIRLRR